MKHSHRAPKKSLREKLNIARARSDKYVEDSRSFADERRRESRLQADEERRAKRAAADERRAKLRSQADARREIARAEDDENLARRRAEKDKAKAVARAKHDAQQIAIAESLHSFEDGVKNFGPKTRQRRAERARIRKEEARVAAEARAAAKAEAPKNLPFNKRVKNFFIRVDRRIKRLKQRIIDARHLFYQKYGVLGCAALVLVPLKFRLFYYLADVRTYVLSSVLLSVLIVALIFAFFKNKWIPTVIYFLLSVFMLCEAMYYSFFNNYLSIMDLGSAVVLHDISDSIHAVARPVFFLLLVDVVVIACALLFKKLWFRGKENWRGFRRVLIALITLSILVVPALDPFNEGFAKGISNQEFFTYHFADLFADIQQSKKDAMDGPMSIFKDTYKPDPNDPLFGVAEGRNVVIIQLESFQDFVINMEYKGNVITPVLNELINDHSIYFDNYYHQIGTGNTSDAELAVNNSIHGTIKSYSYELFKDNYFRGLPVLLKEKGYYTAVYHAYEDRMFWSRDSIYGNLGFDKYYAGLKSHGDGDYEDDLWIGWGITDESWYRQSVDFMKEVQQPFYSFMITLSNHHPFYVPEDLKTLKLYDGYSDNIAIRYIESAHYTDWALGQFFEYMKEAGLYDNSIFLIYGDHVGLTHAEDTDRYMTQLLGHKYDLQDMMNVPFIVHIPGVDVTQTIHTACGHLDVLPTLAYLMGFDKLDTIYFGQNVLKAKHGFVAEETYMKRGSFYLDDIAFEMSRDGIFENSRVWNLETGEKYAPADFTDYYERSIKVMTASEYVLKKDVLRQIYEEGKTFDEINAAGAEEEKERQEAQAAAEAAGEVYQPVEEQYESEPLKSDASTGVNSEAGGATEQPQQ